MKRHRTSIVHSRGFAGKRGAFRIRALNDDEIQQLLLLARETGWWGNPQLIDFVLNAGLDGDERARKRAATDWVRGLNLAREIWIVTLQTIAHRTRAIGKLAGTTRRVPAVQRYSFRNLITPGMLLLIAEDAAKLDVERFTKEVIDETVADISIKGRIVRGAGRRQMIERVFDWLVPKILETWGIENSLFESLPPEVLPTLADRFYAAWRLAQTLDWQQYHRLLDYFHAATEDLLFRSRQLGGSDAVRAQTRLPTVKAAFPDFITPPRHLPPEVCAQLFVDAHENRLSGFAPRLRILLREATTEAFRQMLDAVPGWTSASEDITKEAAGQALLSFLNEMSKYPRIVERACYVYFERFRRSSERFARERAKKLIAEATAFAVADVRFVVEGPSDAIYYKTFSRILLGNKDLLIAVESRNGKADVARRVRDLVRADPTAAIVAVLDADAVDQERELRRLNAQYLHVHRYAKGAIEDQFDATVHVAILNYMCPEGVAFTIDDLAPPFGQTIAKALYTKRTIEFDKCAYAEYLVRRINSAAEVPSTLRSIVTEGIHLAEDRRKKFPPPASALTIDSRTRSALLGLIDRSDLVASKSIAVTAVDRG